MWRMSRMMSFDWNTNWWLHLSRKIGTSTCPTTSHLILAWLQHKCLSLDKTNLIFSPSNHLTAICCWCICLDIFLSDRLAESDYTLQTDRHTSCTCVISRQREKDQPEVIYRRGRQIDACRSSGGYQGGSNKLHCRCWLFKTNPHFTQ